MCDVTTQESGHTLQYSPCTPHPEGTLCSTQHPARHTLRPHPAVLSTLHFDDVTGLYQQHVTSSTTGTGTASPSEDAERRLSDKTYMVFVYIASCMKWCHALIPSPPIHPAHLPASSHNTLYSPFTEYFTPRSSDSIKAGRDAQHN
ncbi:hypothetical protein O3P69_000953 [Scylla paramamosain]|uniref:Uncharacterized protein n=1 Tax=Scylla paramamosain TaxID=85552 RepID=A0AAW0USI3_SCYPA